MRFLMLMWADADAASGDESDFQALGWANKLPTYGYVEVRELLRF